MRYSLNGHIVADGDAPILRWWGIPASCPADIRGALAQNPEGEEFVLEINSGGGSVFAGFEMYSLLRTLRARACTRAPRCRASRGRQRASSWRAQIRRRSLRWVR